MKENRKENVRKAEDVSVKDVSVNKKSRALSDDDLDLVSGSVKAGGGTMIPVHKE